MGLPTVTIGRTTFTILFPELLRPLTERERQELKTSIRKWGVRVPVTVDESNGIIDGGHRAAISAELGLKEIPVALQRALSEEDKRHFALMLNSDRRQLTPADWRRLQEQKKERVNRVADARREGESLRVIAAKEGVSKAQVQADLKEATGQGCPVEPKDGKVKGKDGRERTATPKKNVAQAPAAAGSAADTEQAPEATAKQRSVVLEAAHQAINLLSRVPMNNPYRRRGFQIVTDWIETASK